MIPRDPAILLSYINMKLRNNYRSLRDLCEEEQIDVIELCKLLDKIDYPHTTILADCPVVSITFYLILLI